VDFSALVILWQFSTWYKYLVIGRGLCAACAYEGFRGSRNERTSKRTATQKMSELGFMGLKDSGQDKFSRGLAQIKPTQINADLKPAFHPRHLRAFQSA
jgi:hypothetical protein